MFTVRSSKKKKKKFGPGMRQLGGWGVWHRVRGRSGRNVTLRYSGSLSPRLCEHFKVSELKGAMRQHPGGKWEIRFLRLPSAGRIVSVPPHTHTHPSSQSPRIPSLLIHSVAAYYPDSRPPPPQPLNQGHSAALSRKHSNRKRAGFFESDRAPPPRLLHKHRRGEQHGQA